MNADRFETLLKLLPRAIDSASRTNGNPSQEFAKSMLVGGRWHANVSEADAQMIAEMTPAQMAEKLRALRNGK